MARNPSIRLWEYFLKYSSWTDSQPLWNTINKNQGSSKGNTLDNCVDKFSYGHRQKCKLVRIYCTKNVKVRGYDCSKNMYSKSWWLFGRERWSLASRRIMERERQVTSLIRLFKRWQISNLIKHLAMVFENYSSGSDIPLSIHICIPPYYNLFCRFDSFYSALGILCLNEK